LQRKKQQQILELAMNQKHSNQTFRFSLLLLYITLLLCTRIQHALGFSTPDGYVISTQHRQATSRLQTLRENKIRIQPTCSDKSSTALNLQYVPSLHLDITPVEAETLAGPFFGLSLFPYLAFIYFLNVPENETPKGVTVGFAACLVFVFLTIPAAIAAQLLYGVSLADSDWLHGSAESLLTMTNLVTVVAFRQALRGKEREYVWSEESTTMMPLSATSYQPMTILVGVLTLLAGLTALIPAAMGNPEVHTPYLGGFMDVSRDWVTFGHPEPPNALSIAW
jgi:hypothetical protein